MTETSQAEKPRGRKAEHKPHAVPRLTPAERAARGKAARAEVPRSPHAEWEPPPDRRDPVELLEEQAATRVPELVPIRYGRMLVSPFAFYRGAALSDGGRPRRRRRGPGCRSSSAATRTSRTSARFAAPDRRLVFGVNDFDETLPGPVRVGREAPRGELRGRRPRPRASTTRPRGDGRRRTVRDVPRGDARASPRCGNLDVWYARARRRRRSWTQFAPASDGRSEAKRMRARRRQGADEGQHRGVRRS